MRALRQTGIRTGGADTGQSERDAQCEHTTLDSSGEAPQNLHYQGREENSFFSFVQQIFIKNMLGPSAPGLQ